MIPPPVIERLEQAVRDALAGWPAEWTGFHWPGYTLQHTLRVRRLARRLAEQEGAAPGTVAVAALLHDIAKAEGREHAERGAERARALLDGTLPPERVEAVANTVAAHNCAGPGDPAAWRVLSDADKIDSNYGLVAVARYFTIRGSRDHAIDEALDWVPEWDRRHVELFERLTSEAGRRCAEKRLAVMRAFCSAAERPGPQRAVAQFFLGDCARPDLEEQVERLAADGTPGAGPDALRPIVARLRREMAGEL
jgi:putative nucleotidyltransferase with HDIG domain